MPEAIIPGVKYVAALTPLKSVLPKTAEKMPRKMIGKKREEEGEDQRLLLAEELADLELGPGQADRQRRRQRLGGGVGHQSAPASIATAAVSAAVALPIRSR
jgi:hypothetical protein